MLWSIIIALIKFIYIYNVVHIYVQMDLIPTIHMYICGFEISCVIKCVYLIVEWRHVVLGQKTLVNF